MDSAADAAVLVGIAQGFGRSMAEMLELRPDLIEGFLSGRYGFVVHQGGVGVIEAEVDPLGPDAVR